MSKSKRAQRAERWQRRTHVLTSGAWDDPKAVRDEVSRVEDHIRATEERVTRYAKEVEDLEKLLAEAPARIAKLRTMIGTEGARLEGLRDKRAVTMQRLGGAMVAAETDKLRRKLRDLEMLKARMDRGEVTGPAPKPTHTAAKPGEYTSGLGHTSSDDVIGPR